LIYYTITAALQSKKVDRIVVSTEDEEIAALSKQFGAEVPFLRPFELAQDTSSSKKVLQHAIPLLECYYHETIEHYILLQPTSPLRQPEHIDEAITIFLKMKQSYDSVLGLKEVSEIPYLMNEISSDNRVIRIADQFPEGTRRQDFPKLYIPNGAIYVGKKENLFTMNSILGDKIYPYVMEKEYSIDIDTMFDIKQAEFFLLDRWKNGRTGIRFSQKAGLPHPHRVAAPLLA
jgi:CMP-N,N'-diacetyllegionaminic acid synthase